MARVLESENEHPQAHKKVLELTLEAARIAKAAAASVAANVRNGSCAQAETQLDELDKQVDEKISDCISHASPDEVRELLACTK